MNRGRESREATKQYTWGGRRHSSAAHYLGHCRILSSILWGFLRSAKVASTLCICWKAFPPSTTRWSFSGRPGRRQALGYIKSVSYWRTESETPNKLPACPCPRLNLTPNTCLTLNWRPQNPIAHKLLSVWNPDNRNVKHNELLLL